MADLAIGILTHDDYDGAYFTMSSIRMHHKEVAHRIKFVVVDNSPDSPHGEELYKFCKHKRDVDYHQIRNVNSSTFKNLTFELSPAPAVLQIDSHVLLQPGALAKLIKFYEAFPDCHDLLQGPLYGDDNRVIATHMDPNWRGGCFGTWAINNAWMKDSADLVEFPLHGMGLFACTRAGWPRFAGGMWGFGAEEGAIQEKFRLLGRKAYFVNFLGWMHRFGRPGGTTYLHKNDLKVKNYIAAFREVRLPIDSILEHFGPRLHPVDSAARQRWIEQQRAFEASLPTSHLSVPQGYTPFLGQSIGHLPDSK